MNDILSARDLVMGHVLFPYVVIPDRCFPVWC